MQLCASIFHFLILRVTKYRPLAKGKLIHGLKKLSLEYILEVIFKHFQSGFIMPLIKSPRPFFAVCCFEKLDAEQSTSVPKPASSLFIAATLEKHFNDWATDCFKNTHYVNFIV